MSTPTPSPARHLILVKHSLPTVVPNIPAPQWALSDAGRDRCTHLASALARYRPTTIAASDEPKARETAQLLAAELGFDGALLLDHDLREHERQPADFFPDPAAFAAAVRDLFARPQELVFGQETAAAAAARFDAAIARTLAASPAGDVIVVAHGTVIALFAAAHAGLDPFTLWQRLQLPSFVVLALPDLRWVATVPSVAG